MLEHEIERRLGAMLKKENCLYLKFVSPGCVGVPDRIVICPDGRLYFVELKTDRGVVSKQQQEMIRKLRHHGQAAFVIRGMADANEFVNVVRMRKELGLDGV